MPVTLRVVEPAAGSLCGGTAVSVYLSDATAKATALLFNNVPCPPGKLVVHNFSKATCLENPAGSGDVDVRVVLSDGKMAERKTAYTYAESHTPRVESISPNTGAGDDVLHVLGTKIGGFALEKRDVNTIVEVLDGAGDTDKRRCVVEPEMSSANGNFVQCRLPSAPAGAKKISVRVANLGRACFGVSPISDKFTYQLRLATALKSPFDPLFEADGKHASPLEEQTSLGEKLWS